MVLLLSAGTRSNTIKLMLLLLPLQSSRPLNMEPEPVVASTLRRWPPLLLPPLPRLRPAQVMLASTEVEMFERRTSSPRNASRKGGVQSTVTSMLLPAPVFMTCKGAQQPVQRSV